MISSLVEFIEKLPEEYSFDTETTGLDVKAEGFRVLGTSIAYRYLPDIYSLKNYGWIEKQLCGLIDPIFIGVCNFRNRLEYMYWGIKSIYVYFNNLNDKSIEFENGVWEIPYSDARELFELILNRKGIKIPHNAKYDLEVVEECFGIRVEKDIKDTMLMSYLLDETLKAKHGLKDLSERYLIPIDKFIGDLFIQYAVKSSAHYGKNDSIATYRLKEIFFPRLQKEQLLGVFDLDSRTMFVAKDMELNGMYVDEDHLFYLEKECSKMIIKLKDEIFKLAGRSFLISSPKQVAQVFFNELKIPYNPSKVGKSGIPATSQSALEGIKGYEIIDKMLKFREYMKLQGTYLIPLRHKRDKDGRIRPSYNQFITETGRFSSSGKLNAQNIPKKLDDLKIRKVFIAEKGNVLIIFDLSQIELRIAAHFSGSKNMISIYERKGDIHRETGAKIKKLINGEVNLSLTQEDLDNVTSDERTGAKTVSLGILYGREAVSVAEQLGVEVEAAKDLIAGYFELYPEIKLLEEKCFNDVMTRGYIRTISGRKRRFIFDKNNKYEVARVRRQAINTLIQGCLDKNSRILTHKGYYTISELLNLNEDLKVWTGFKWANAKILNMGKSNMFEVIFKNGWSIKCDNRHKFKKVDKNIEWIGLEDLSLGDMLAIPKLEKLEWGEHSDYCLMQRGKVTYLGYDRVGYDVENVKVDSKFIYYLLGYYLGDGWIGFPSQKRGVYQMTMVFGSEEKDKRIINYFEDQFKKIGIIPTKSICKKKSDRHSIVTKLVVGNTGFVKSFVDLFGLTQVNAKTKYIPDKIFKSSLDLRKEFIRGFIESDGCIKISGVTFHSPNYKLLKSFGFLMMSCGFMFNMYKDNKNNGLLSIVPKNEVLNWLQLKEGKKNSKGYFLQKIPHVYLKEFRDKLFGEKVNVKNISASMQTLRCRLMQKDIGSFYAFKECCKSYGVFLSEEYSLLEVSEVKNLGYIDDTFTLDVEDDLHQFVAEGVISKNSSADIFKLIMVRIQEKYQNKRVKMLSQVHDAVIMEVKEEEAEELMPEIKYIAENPFQTTKLRVPLVADIEITDCVH